DTLHAVICRELLGKVRSRKVSSPRNDERVHSIQDVMAPGGDQRKFSKRFSTLRDAKPHSFAIDGEPTRHPIIPVVETLCFHGTKSFFRSAPQSRARFF